jgi:hypothetical protein
VLLDILLIYFILVIKMRYRNVSIKVMFNTKLQIPCSNDKFLKKAALSDCFHVTCTEVIIDALMFQQKGFEYHITSFFVLFSHRGLVFMMQQSQCIHQEETYRQQRLIVAR